MSEWYDNEMKRSSNFRQLVQERFDKVNRRRKLTAEETKRVNKLEAIAKKFSVGKMFKTVSYKHG